MSRANRNALNATTILNTAQASRTPLRFRSRFEAECDHGFVLATGPDLVLMAILRDGIYLNGFSCYRIKDLRDVEPDTVSEFIRKGLQLRSQRIPRNPRLNLTSTGELVLSAGRVFPVITVHRELVDPDCCWIGRVLKVTPRRVSIQCLLPGAVWDDEPTEYTPNQITRLDFGGDYEAGLILAAGEPPALKPTTIQ